MFIEEKSKAENKNLMFHQLHNDTNDEHKSRNRYRHFA